MKTTTLIATLITTLSLAAAATLVRAAEPPLLAPDWTEGFFQGPSGLNAISNAGTADGYFVIREGEGDVTLVEDAGKKVLHFGPTALESHENRLLPSVVFSDMPQDFVHGVTFEVRIRPDSIWMIPQCEILSARATDRGPGMAISYRPEGGYVDVVSGEGPSSESSSTENKFWGILSDEKAKIPADEWTHLTAVYDASKKQFLLYINGALAAQSEEGLDLTPMNSTFTIGSYNAGYAYPFRGEMRDIAVYDYVRSEEEIRKDADDQ